MGHYLYSITEKKSVRQIFWGNLFRQQITCILLVIVGFLIASFSLSWLKQLNIVPNGIYLYLPAIISVILTQVIMKISPTPRFWSRGLIVTILISLTLRYLYWRSLSSLNLSNPIDGIFSISLFFLELVVIFSSLLQLYLMYHLKDRRREADYYSQQVINKQYSPSVDILIPTYNESTFILKRTIIGCTLLNHKKKKIYVLDDTNRDEVKQLAKELGCYYISRSDNIHAKAGNLNNALPQTNGELIVVFDADFVPTTNFLERTIGFFQNPKIGLLQTPQSFYNADPISRNLGLEDILNPEEEVFYRQLQMMKDGVGSVICAGTSFVVRRSYLEQVGGFVTESISEDYFTGIRLSSQGYEIIYLSEKLSAGLAAESISEHISQRLRWGRGTLQAFFIKENPLTIPNLTFKQRLAHLEGILHWFNGIPRCLFLMLPFLYSIFNIVFIRITSDDFIYIFLPCYITHLSVFHWLSFKTRSVIFSDIYSLISCFPTSYNSLKVIFNPFNTKFRVTIKGISRNHYVYNFKLALPLIIFLIINLISLVVSLFSDPSSVIDLNIGTYWSLYNTLIICVALLAFLDKPKPSIYDSFPLRKKVKIIEPNQVIFGKTLEISEEEATILAYSKNYVAEQFTLKLDDLKIDSYIIGEKRSNNQYQLKIKFKELTLQQHTKLINILYSHPQRWKSKELKTSPGEFLSLTLAIAAMFKFLRIIFLSKHRKTRKLMNN
ncbi:glycosyltransferase [Crocosphaera sp.]|uniref:glycosyltransferase family 2 protein n=1 Tax=Crocosphaera sp. TaxID=2729996 RepID=UPI00263107A1|nr:glycosyltransferase [Crocosphaera sp.]MDJ0579009.1 glycosyltransferase [Crocosphaera sp.]